MKREIVASIYFLVQAVAGLVWWIMIRQDLYTAERFFPVANARNDLTTFQLADIAWFVGGSALAAILIWLKSRLAFPVVWMVVGAVGYATLCTFGLLLNGGRLLAIGMMLAAFAGTFLFALQVPRESPNSS